MKRHNVLGMAVGCYLAAFKKDERGPALLGMNHEDDVKNRAAEVLGVARESVKNWMQEFLPYWAKSRRSSIEPSWVASDLKGRPREAGMTRESRDRMFADFELLPEADFVSLAKAILDIARDGRFGPDYMDELVTPYLGKSEQGVAFSGAEVAARVASGRLPKVLKKPEGNKHPERRKSEKDAYAFARDLDVVAWALQRAKGYCELCGRPGPFQGNDGNLFLEVHHVLALSDGGPDTVDNVAELCPNCHRACHLAQNRCELAASLRQKLSNEIL